MHGLIVPKSKHAREALAKISSFVAAAFALAVGLSASAQVGAPTPQEIARQMTLEQKVGQIMVWSFQGTELTAGLEEVLTKYQLGSLIFFGRNIQSTHQIAKLNTELQKIASKKLKAPLFLMVDQEGGVVTRVKISTPLPSALALGKTEDAELIQNFARVKGELIQGLGFNFNLSPVVDISDPVRDSFIGNRTFGGDPATVTAMAMAYSRGMGQAGVIPTAKHFPGHGGEISDSHRTTPTKVATVEQLEERDFVPFKEFSQAPLPRAIMTAHLALPNVDSTGTAATYSPVLIKEWLRTKLGYQGLIVTDDLEMAGAAVSADVGERAIRAFRAGHDLIMLAGPFANQRRAYNSLVYAVKDGRISEEQLTESVVRILEMKLQLKLASTKVDERKATGAIRKLHGLSRDIMQKNFKAAMAEVDKAWPVVERNTQAVVFSSTKAFSYRFEKAFKGRSRHFPLTPQTLGNVATELARENIKLGVFYASGSKTAQWLNNLSPELKSKVIVVNCNHAGKVDDQDSFLGVINLNSHSPDSGEWLAAELSKPRPLPEPEPELEQAPLAPEEPDSVPPDIRTPAGDLESSN